MIFRLGELFSGPGGLALAASRASVESNGEEYKIIHGWANDMDADTCATYLQNIPGADIENVLCQPVQSLDIPGLPSIDGLAFGFPCNDYSIAGEQKGLAGTFGPLYSYGEKVLNTHRPKWFVAENVGGLQSANEGKAFQEITSKLQAAGPGYMLTVHLYKFEQYGVAQTRHRIVIVGIERALGLKFQVPAPTTLRPVTASEALAGIPSDALHNEASKHSDSVIERLKHIPAGENVWYKGLPSHMRLNVKTTTMSHIYRRLHPDKPSCTLTASGGGGTHGYHWCENRELTNRERARIQSFPDDFAFAGSKESIRKQIGMAVPPAGAQVIFEALLKTFAGIPYPFVPARWEIEGSEDPASKAAGKPKRSKAVTTLSQKAQKNNTSSYQSTD